LKEKITEIERRINENEVKNGYDVKNDDIDVKKYEKQRKFLDKFNQYD
jgi:hypothetical protein